MQNLSTAKPEIAREVLKWGLTPFSGLILYLIFLR
jgi:hypothetical protein